MRDALSFEIFQALENHPDKELVPYLRRIAMRDSLHAFVLDAINKYYKGQREHGGDITDRNLYEEVRHEQIDQFWFHEAARWQGTENLT